MFPREPHVPFLKDTRHKDMDGVYRSKETGHIHVVKNVHQRAVIPEGHKEPVREFTCSLKSTEHGEHRRISLIDVPWEFLLPL